MTPEAPISLVVGTLSQEMMVMSRRPEARHRPAAAVYAARRKIKGVNFRMLPKQPQRAPS